MTQNREPTPAHSPNRTAWITRIVEFVREFGYGIDTAHAIMLGIEPGPRPADRRRGDYR